VAFGAMGGAGVKIFIAMLGTETNRFSPMPTGYEQIAEGYLVHGGEARDGSGRRYGATDVFRRLAEERGWEVIESLGAFAQPAGPTVRRVYEGFGEEIVEDLRRAMPVDAVLLSMHGAMIAEGYDDCEGDLLGPRVAPSVRKCRSARCSTPTPT